MAIIISPLEGSNGALVTRTNSGASRSFDTLSGSTMTYTTAFKHLGATSVSATSSCQLIWNVTTQRSLMRGYAYFNAAPSTDYTIANNYNSAATKGAQVEVAASGLKLRLRTYGGSGTSTIQWTSSTSFPIGSWVRWELYTDMGTSNTNGAVRLAFYAIDATTPLDDSGLISGIDVGGTSGAHATARFNVSSALWVDDIGLKDGTDASWGTWVAATTPTAAFTATEVGLSASFDASSSVAPSGSITTYNWNFGNGSNATGATPTHTYASAGSYTVTLTITDSLGQTASTSQTITVTAPAQPTATLRHTFEAFSNGAAITTGIASPTALTHRGVSGSGSVTATSTNKVHGSMGMAASGTAGSSTVAAVGWYDANNAFNRLAYSAWFRIFSAPGVDQRILNALTTAGTTAVPYAIIKANGKLSIWTASHSPVGNMADVTVPLDGTPFEVRMYIEKGTTTSNGTIRYSVHAFNGSVISAANYTNVNAGTTTFGGMRAGRATNADWTGTIYVDDLAMDSLATDLVQAYLPASLTATFTHTKNGLSIEVDGSNTSNPNGGTSTYSWAFGDGNTTTGITASHTYASAGTYTVTLTVSDGTNTDSSIQSITVEAPPAGQGVLVAGVAHDAEWRSPSDVLWEPRFFPPTLGYWNGWTNVQALNPDLTGTDALMHVGGIDKAVQNACGYTHTVNAGYRNYMNMATVDATSSTGQIRATMDYLCYRNALINIWVTGTNESERYANSVATAINSGTYDQGLRDMIDRLPIGSNRPNDGKMPFRFWIVVHHDWDIHAAAAMGGDGNVNKTAWRTAIRRCINVITSYALTQNITPYELGVGGSITGETMNTPGFNDCDWWRDINELLPEDQMPFIVGYDDSYYYLTNNGGMYSCPDVYTNLQDHKAVFEGVGITRYVVAETALNLVDTNDRGSVGSTSKIVGTVSHQQAFVQHINNALANKVCEAIWVTSEATGASSWSGDLVNIGYGTAQWSNQALLSFGDAQRRFNRRGGGHPGPVGLYA